MVAENEKLEGLTIEEWKKLTYELLKQCEFALLRLKSQTGNNLLLDMSDENATEWPTIHWKDRMIDVMEKVPGIRVDRTKVKY